MNDAPPLRSIDHLRSAEPYHLASQIRWELRRVLRSRGQTTAELSHELGYSRDVVYGWMYASRRFSASGAAALDEHVGCTSLGISWTELQSHHLRLTRAPAGSWFSTRGRAADFKTTGIGVAAFLTSTTTAIIAGANDAQAFTAIATPTVYAWLALSLVCVVGLATIPLARRRGQTVPAYYTLILLLGSLTAFAALPTTLRVLGKDAGTPPPVSTLASLDLRNESVRDRSFADRNLTGAQLAGAHLTHVDFRDSTLAESDLRGAIIDDVNFTGVDLCGADVRSADLSGAVGLESVTRWDYLYYNDETKLPADIDQGFLSIPGPLKDTGRGLLYMCSPNSTRRLVD